MWFFPVLGNFWFLWRNFDSSSKNLIIRVLVPFFQKSHFGSGFEKMVISLLWLCLTNYWASLLCKCAFLSNIKAFQAQHEGMHANNSVWLLWLTHLFLCQYGSFSFFHVFNEIFNLGKQIVINPQPLLDMVYIFICFLKPMWETCYNENCHCVSKHWRSWLCNA